MTDGQKTRKILITGGAGFIGGHLTERLLAKGDRVFVIDNFNDFYDPTVKRSNVAAFSADANYKIVSGDIRDDRALDEVFEHGPFDVVVHLAAMAGVRPSLVNPSLYMDVNVNGSQKLIDRIVPHAGHTRLVFGSSSSVYGARSGESFKESDMVDQPLSPYAASKAANELQCYAAHHTTGLAVVCLRFFTVFGPRQRPDLAIHKFCHLIDEGKTIELFGDGTSKRDYTFVLDIVSGIEAAMSYALPGFDIINLGRGEPVVLIDMVRSIEKHLNKNASIIHKEMQIGDVPYTYADIEHARSVLGYNPATTFDQGVKAFVDWYVSTKALV
ncbi:MAG: SDR family NAD(P)-dependent oxidoreductase [Cyanobacteria bacterium REEB67]|nr:SDR family NAD(P)-dependent oxidoreductase [Cyanobacteria bacterium REEB67]